jgi:hypothetical protein
MKNGDRYIYKMQFTARAIALPQTKRKHFVPNRTSQFIYHYDYL